MTATTEPDESTQAPPPSLATFVRGKVHRLLATQDSSGTKATLAHLRRALAREPGSVPEVWDVTIDGVPGRPWGDEPTPQERASHLALGLFATHQQSKSQPMHVSGVGLGLAVRRLEKVTPTRGDGGSSPVRRRFDALASSQTLTEAAQHLRGIVGLLRAASIGLDYGALADDLLQLQRPDRAVAVRLRWARQYYRTDGSTSTDESSTEAAPAADPTHASDASTEPEETHS